MKVPPGLVTQASEPPVMCFRRYVEAPTRELAQQIEKEAKVFSRSIKVRALQLLTPVDPPLQSAMVSTLEKLHSENPVSNFAFSNWSTCTRLRHGVQDHHRGGRDEHERAAVGFAPGRGGVRGHPGGGQHSLTRTRVMGWTRRRATTASSWLPHSLSSTWFQPLIS
jgi:hypothetical protein